MVAADIIKFIISIGVIFRLTCSRVNVAHAHSPGHFLLCGGFLLHTNLVSKCTKDLETWNFLNFAGFLLPLWTSKNVSNALVDLDGFVRYTSKQRMILTMPGSLFKIVARQIAQAGW